MDGWKDGWIDGGDMFQLAGCRDADVEWVGQLDAGF
jgi:hypothetical protein